MSFCSLFPRHTECHQGVLGSFLDTCSTINTRNICGQESVQVPTTSHGAVCLSQLLGIGEGISFSVCQASLIARNAFIFISAVPCLLVGIIEPTKTMCLLAYKMMFLFFLIFFN